MFVRRAVQCISIFRCESFVQSAYESVIEEIIGRLAYIPDICNDFKHLVSSRISRVTSSTNITISVVPTGAMLLVYPMSTFVFS